MPIGKRMKSALTKVDRVDAQRLQEVRDEIASFVHGSVLQDAPVFNTCATRADRCGLTRTSH